MAGHMLDKIEQSGHEVVIDLELRGNRADCYSIIGIAKEVSALFNTPVIYPPFYPPLKQVPQLSECRLEIKTPLVNRVMATAIKNVRVGPTPPLLKKRLEAYGVPSLNNIVDATNYVMLETGEPMHAFDLDQVAPTLTIRLAKNKEKMATFLGTIIALTKDDLVWAKGSVLVSIGGAIGGKIHSINEKTKNILIEAANYDRANIRRTIYRHNLMTDAGIRHEKDLDPNMVPEAIYRFLELVKEYNWGKIETSVFDYYPKPKKPLTIFLDYENLLSLGGMTISPVKVKKILQGLNCQIQKETTKGIFVVCPTYRTDLVLPADLVEEVIRIEGYDKIPPKTLSLEVPPVTTPISVDQENKIRLALQSLGFDELINMPFVKESLNISGYRPVEIANPPSEDFKQMRLTMSTALLASGRKAFSERKTEVRFFEIGKIYYRIGSRLSYKRLREKRKLGIIFGTRTSLPFSSFKGYLDTLFSALGIENLNYHEQQGDFSLASSFKITIGKKSIGAGGKTPEGFHFAEVDLDSLLGRGRPPKAKLWPKYPPFIEDISLVIPAKTNLGPLITTIKSVSPLIGNIELIDSYQNTRTFRLTYQSDKKSLSDEEVKPIREKIIAVLGEKFAAYLKE